MTKKIATLALTSLSVLTLAACSNQLVKNIPGLSKPSSSQTASSTAESSAAAKEDTNQTALASISQDDAKQAALSILGLSEEEVENLTVQEDTEDGRPVFEVEFNHDGQEYSYTIDAQTGNVVERDSEQADDTVVQDDATTAEMLDAELTEDDAKAIVFADFSSVYGVGEESVGNLTVKQESEDGATYYEVDFQYDGYDFTYDVDTTTGEIIGFDQEWMD